MSLEKFYGYTYTYLWWPILHITNFWRLILYTYFPMFDLFSISTTFSRPGVHTSDFYGLFYMYVPPFAELIFTRDILWLHVHIPLVTHSVYIPRKWFKSYVLPLHYLVGTLVIFMDYFVHFLLFGELIFTWEIFYDHVRVPLTTYSVHIPPNSFIFVQREVFEGFFWTHIS